MIAERGAGLASAGTVTDLARPLWRALAVFRVLSWGFAVLGVYTRWDDLHRRWGAVVLLVVMAGRTVGVSLGYSRTWGRRNTRLAILDLVLTVACVAGTLLAQPLEAIHGGASIDAIATEAAMAERLRLSRHNRAELVRYAIEHGLDE